MAHTRCMLDKEDYTPAHARAGTHMRAHTCRQICNTYCFSTAKMISRTRFGVTLYVRCLASFYLQCLEIRSGAYSASCLKGTSCYFTEVKWPGRET